MAIIIAGYIRSAQLRYTADQKAVCDIRFAFSQRTGQTSITREIPASAWNVTAEKAAQTYANGGYAILEAAYRDEVVEREGGVREHFPSLLVSHIHPGHEGLELDVVSLVGTAGVDSELKYFESGAVKASNRLAIRRTKDITDWINLEAWGRDAETMGNYVLKGKQIVVEGSFKIDVWTDKTTGQERTRPTVAVDRLTLLGSKLSASKSAPVPSFPSRSAPQAASQAAPPAEDQYADMPF
jgi:single-strand DNA-binding protein